ncbi:ATP-binding protein [Actinoplanes sp. NPDC020271]|uniref:sensor histidine kinase n=1 Tax=Actinoplanes sp. NPDC020271 TaxID=3363896 RepID=UPI0037A01A4C
MRAGWSPRTWWQFIAVPLAIWLVLTASGTAALLWAQSQSRTGLVQRFETRLDLIRDFVGSYVTDLLDRERIQAEALLADPAVTQREFARSVGGFGYPAAVLLDARGRLLHAVPDEPAMTGKDLTGTYAHLRIAVRDGRPAVSPVVESVVRREPVVAFAVPFATGSGRRVFSGAVAISDSPLSSYLSTAWTFDDIRVQLTDDAGMIAASNRKLNAASPSLSGNDPDLARALTASDQGRYRAGGRWWRYAAMPVPGAPWRLSATVPEEVLFGSVHGNETAGRVAVVTAAGVGLLVVVAAARARRNRRELQASEQRFRKVFDSSRIGMLIADPRGRFLRVNPELARMLGHPPEDLVGRDFTEFTHPDDTAPCVQAVDDCRAGRLDGFELEKRYRHADGHYLEVIVTSILLRDPGGQPQFFAAQIIDMTERNTLKRTRDRQQAELAERAEELQLANAQMADFITMLTHDVRQPLTGIVAGGELLIEEWPELTDEDRIHRVRQMTAGGHRADQLVAEILTLAQLDAGAIVARPVVLDLSQLVPEAITAQGLPPGKPITVLAPDRSIAVADPTHLQLILGNLLGNAVKYGAPPVTVHVIGRPHHVEIQVTDNGEGVPEAFVPHLFDRFARAETGVAITKPGTGLGLYLVRQLASAGGITVAYRPHSPHGSTFVLTVPRPPLPPADVSATAVPLRRDAAVSSG